MEPGGLKPEHYYRAERWTGRVERTTAWRWLTMRIRSSSSRRRLLMNRSAMAFTRGAWIGVVTICMPAAVNTVSRLD